MLVEFYIVYFSNNPRGKIVKKLSVATVWVIPLHFFCKDYNYTVRYSEEYLFKYYPIDQYKEFCLTWFHVKQNSLFDMKSQHCLFRKDHQNNKCVWISSSPFEITFYYEAAVQFSLFKDCIALEFTNICKTMAKIFVFCLWWALWKKN